MEKKLLQLKITPEDPKQQPELLLLHENQCCRKEFEEEKIVKNSMAAPKIVHPKSEQFDFAQKVPHKKRSKFYNIITDDQVVEVIGDEEWLKERPKSQIESTKG